MKEMTFGSPSSFLRLVKHQGFVGRILLVSRSMTSRLAPTYCARSVLFITKNEDFVMPGPPFLGIFSPSATSMT